MKNSFHIDHMKMISPQCVLSGGLKDKLNKKNSSHNDYMEMVFIPSVRGLSYELWQQTCGKTLLTIITWKWVLPSLTFLVAYKTSTVGKTPFTLIK